MSWRSRTESRTYHVVRPAPCVLVALIGVGCGATQDGSHAAAGGGTSEPFGADPRNLRFDRLAHDPLFSQVPPGATTIKITKRPAWYRAGNMFERGAWQGPSVVLRFASTTPLRAVYAFFAQRALAAGWTPVAGKTLYIGVTWQWSKTFSTSGGQSVAFLISDHDPGAALHVESYTLTGSA